MPYSYELAHPPPQDEEEEEAEENEHRRLQKLDKIVDSLKELTLLEAWEASELVKAIEETFDVDASASAGTDAAPEKTEFDLVLKQALKEKKFAVINSVRAITGLGLKDAKGLADNPGKAPSEAVQPAASTSNHRKKKKAKKPVPKVGNSGPSVTKPGLMTEIELLEYIKKMDMLPWEQQDQASSEAVQPAASTSNHRKEEAKKPVPKVGNSGPSVTKPRPWQLTEILELEKPLHRMEEGSGPKQKPASSKLRASAPEFKYACDGSYGYQMISNQKQTSYNQMACGGAMACQGWNQWQFNQWQSQAGWNGNDGQYDSYGNYVGPRTYGNDYNNCYYDNYGGNWQNAAWGSA